MTTTAILIPVTGDITRLDLDPEHSLEQLQTAVGGNIEALPMPYLDPITGYINEEGKYLCIDEDGNVEVNQRATKLMLPGTGLHDGDFIAGPFVIAGFDPNTGEHIDLPDTYLTLTAE